MELQYRCATPGRTLIRRLYEPLGVQSSAEAAALKYGWNRTTRLIYYDSDGLALGGFVPSGHPRSRET